MTDDPTPHPAAGECDQPFGHRNPHPKDPCGADYPCIDWRPLSREAEGGGDK